MVETKEGSLLAAWYAGSGERKSDDVVIEGAWLAKGKARVGAEVPDGRHARLPRLQPGALRSRPMDRSGSSGPRSSTTAGKGRSSSTPVANTPRREPRRSHGRGRGCLHVTPKDFADEMQKRDRDLEHRGKGRSTGPDWTSSKQRSRDELYQRLGWMPRVHPVVLPSGRWILPLYSDTFSASIMAISDDRGATWTASRPLIGFGNIQPSLVRKNDGVLVAFMRDNGPHRRIRLSTSQRRRRFVVAGDRFLLSQPRRRHRGHPAGERPLGPDL